MVSENRSGLPVWTGVDTDPMAWDNYRYAIQGHCASQGLASLLWTKLEPVKLEETNFTEKNLKLLGIFLQTTKDLAGMVVRPFCDQGDGVGAWNALITRYGNDCKELRQARQIEYTQRVLETECKNMGSILDTVHKLEHLFTELEKLECGLPDPFKRNYLLIRLKDTAPEIYTSVAQDMEMKYDATVNNIKRLAALNSAIDETRGSETEGCYMKGLVTKDRNICEHCRKTGHNKENCWTLNPKRRPDNGMKSKRSMIKCYNCGKTGHIKRNCPGEEQDNVIATLNNNNTDVIDCYMRTFVDS